jgi:hypothetical protein
VDGRYGRKVFRAVEKEREREREREMRGAYVPRGEEKRRKKPKERERPDRGGLTHEGKILIGLYERR